jgi:hypothetical protein
MITRNDLVPTVKNYLINLIRVQEKQKKRGKVAKEDSRKRKIMK